MRKFLKKLLCWHYWNDGDPVQLLHRLGLMRYTCVKCGKEKMRVWPWGIHENVWKHRAD
jgi:hypothetical protein